MKLTQDQIQFINRFLLKNEVKYWDIRLELTDHFISAIEEKMTMDKSFDEALMEVHQSFGNKVSKYILAKDFSGWFKENGLYADHSGYKKLIEEKRKVLHKQFNPLNISWLKSPKSIVLFVISVFFLFGLIQTLNTKAAVIVSFVIILAPIVMLLTYSIVRGVKKRFRRSLYFSTASTSAFSGILIWQIMLYIPEYTIGWKAYDYPVWYLVLFVVVASIFNISSYLLYKREYQKCKDLLEKLDLASI